MSGLPSTTPRTTVLSEFDEMMISKSIATREQRLRAKGFTAEQAAEILEAEAEEVAAEVNAAATQQLAQGDGYYALSVDLTAAANAIGPAILEAVEDVWDGIRARIPARCGGTGVEPEQ